MSYCSVQDVRDFGITDDIDDTRVIDAISTAEGLIFNYTGRTFSSPSSGNHTVEDVYGDQVPLPAPFSNVTAVTINDRDDPLHETAYEVRTWGIKINYPPAEPYDVKVTATFGFATDSVIREATIILASGIAFRDVTDNHAGSNISGISFASGGVQTSFGQGRGLTTGNPDVDDMLWPYLYAGNMVD